MKKEEKDKVKKLIKKYCENVGKKIPMGLILSHGYSLDNRKEWNKLMKGIDELK